MNLSDAKAVAETTNLKEVNARLKLGWILIGSASMTTNSNEYSGPVIKYSLIWTKDGAAPNPSFDDIH